MFLHSLRWRRRPARGAPPVLERLESRRLMHCVVEVSGHTLRVIGDDGPNRVTITDDGAGNVAAVCDTVAAAGTGIQKVEIYTLGGPDNVTYTFGTLTTNRDIDVDLGDGGGLFNLLPENVPEAGVAADLKLDVTGGDGSDSVGVGFLGFIAGHVQIKADLGDSFDGLTLFDTAALEFLEGSKLKLDFSGGEGSDAAGAILSDSNIHAGAMVDLNLEGGAGDDDVGFTFNGRLDGRLKVDVNGDDGSDILFGNVDLASGSLGSFFGDLKGEDDDDNLRLHIVDAGTSATVNALLDGGRGFDICAASPNVEVRNCEGHPEPEPEL